MGLAARRGLKAVALNADITDAAAVAAAIGERAPSRFLHLAGISFVGHADPRDIYEVNLVGTINTLEALAALAVPPRQVVLASSASVYGATASSPITEDAVTEPVTHYGISKLAMEQAARLYADRLPIVIARPFNYTGPGQTEDFLIPKLVEHFRGRAERVQLGQLDVEREFNDVRFVCDAYAGLLERGEPGQVYNLCTGRPLTLGLVMETLARLTGHRLDVEVDPALVRANEVRRLCGDPSRLFGTVGAITIPELEDTLRWMLAAA
jgi:nucleoside-diphosphate-sugar epimerase